MKNKVVSSAGRLVTAGKTKLALAILVAMSVRPAAAITSGLVVAWGGGQTGIPAALTNATAISTAVDHTLALSANGTVIAWGYDFDGQTDVPNGLNQVVAISAGQFFSVALKSDGTVLGWGDNQFNQLQIPADATNVTALSAGRGHVL